MSNVNLNNINNSGNTGRIPTTNMGIISAIVLVPAGFTIPASDMVDNATFATFVNGKFVNDDRSQQWFAMTNLDKFTDDTKKTSKEDTGIYQLSIYSFPANFSFRYMQSVTNFLEALQFQNCQGSYDFFFIDTNGTWWGTYDTTGAGGLAPFTNQQFFIPNWMPKTVSTDAQFFIEITLASQKQFNANLKYYEANTVTTSIQMLENAVLSDISSVVGSALGITTTTDIVITAKMGQDSQDIIQKYSGSLTKACFVAKDLTAGTTLTISSMTFGLVVVAGQAYYYGWAILSAAPTSGHKVQVSTASAATVAGIVPSLHCTTVIVTPGADGQNAAVHTF